MSMDNIFGIAGTALNAQLTRMNATASNRPTPARWQAQKKTLSAPSAQSSKPWSMNR